MTNKRYSSLKMLFAVLMLALAALACSNGGTPTAMVEATHPASTVTPTAQIKPPTETPAPTFTLAPANTPLPSATPLIPTQTIVPPSPTPTALPPAPTLSIVAFTVDAQDLADGGKRFTFKWATSGAASVSIYSGAHMRFPQWWSSLPPTGVYTADVSYSYYRDPAMSLTAYDDQGNQVSQSVTVTWPCQYTYFFTPELATCPAFEASFTAAAQEPFEKGRMIWLKEVRIGDYAVDNQILVLFDNGDLIRYDDTWTDSEPDRDPSIVPPSGFFQPIRGFGKVWRANEQVRNGLGWALAEEAGYEAAMQQEAHESLFGSLFIRTRNGQIINLPAGWPQYPGVSRWESYQP
jgi:hypothetical protein